MFRYRITKYNPCYRDSQGIYMRDEWTDYSDIGKFYQGKKVTYNDYIPVEQAYIQTILLFMDCLKIKSLRVEGLEKSSTREEHIKKIGCSVQWFKLIRNTLDIPQESVPEVVQLILRNQLWCRLVNSEMYAHFGYDYYMYIGSVNSCSSTLIAIKKIGLFVELFESPYHPKKE